MLIDIRLKTAYNTKFKLFVQTVLRYHLAIIILQYALSKVFMLQFGSMGISTMEDSFGEMTPMGLMWNFLSYSETLVRFSGWIEVVGGLLLFFRKTTYLGAVLLFSVMANVVLMDIGYNVSVTLYAVQLFLLIIVLLSSQFKSLFTYLILQKITKSSPYNSLFKNTRLYKASLILKTLLLAGISYKYVTTYQKRIRDETYNTTSWFTGKHTVYDFIVNNDTIPLDSNDNLKLWREVIFNGYSYYPESFKVIHNDTVKERYKFEIDSMANTIRYRPYLDDKVAWNTINYQKTGDRDYMFEGIFDDDTLQFKTKIKRPEDYKLMQQKGRWLIDLK